jgi:hypothetical protein
LTQLKNTPSTGNCINAINHDKNSQTDHHNNEDPIQHQSTSGIRLKGNVAIVEGMVVSGILERS